MSWEPKFDHAEARRMRATGEYTVAQLAAHFGVTKGAISQATADVAPNADPVLRARRAKTPETATEMLELALPELWLTFKGAKGISKKAAFDAIAAAAKRERDEGPAESEREPLIADVVAGAAALSPTRKREILSGEQERLREEIAAVEAALATMDAEVMVA